MRVFLLLAVSVLFVPAVCEAARPAVVVIDAGSAQDAAVVLARRGALVHTGCGQTEGIGFSTVSADHAISRCCFWGKRKPRDIGVARGARGWYAVVRYY
jgi:hypothetical protein